MDRINYLIDKDGIVRFIQSGVPRNDIFTGKIKSLENEALERSSQ